MFRFCTNKSNNSANFEIKRSKGQKQKNRFYIYVLTFQNFKSLFPISYPQNQFNLFFSRQRSYTQLRFQIVEEKGNDKKAHGRFLERNNHTTNILSRTKNVFAELRGKINFTDVAFEFIAKINILITSTYFAEYKRFVLYCFRGKKSIFFRLQGSKERDLLL